MPYSESTFLIRPIDSRLSEDLEQLGTKPKFWFTLEGQRTMFKGDDRDTGEDWAEVIAAEICTMLGLPHVSYELAHDARNSLPGVVCPNIAAKPLTLVLGNQLLVEVDPNYPENDDKKYGVHEHTVAAVARVLETLDPPPADGCWLPTSGCHTAVDVFVGYILLDTLIANQDRHHQNWGALRDKETTWLAPTFDHGAGLARNETETKRQRRLQAGDRDRQMMAFAKRARSGFYRSIDDKRTLHSHDCFEAWRRLRPSAGNHWLNRLASLTTQDFKSQIARVPDSRMTRVAKEFTLELLTINQRLLLEHLENHA